MAVDSRSVGDPACFLTLEALRSGLAALPPAPRDTGSVASIVIRGGRGQRATPDRVRLTPAGGVAGDSWGRQEGRSLDAQIAVMQADAARLIANGQPLTLFGDSLFLTLDLSESNISAACRLRVGTAVVEVTSKPHNGCLKFRGRFGGDALRFVSAGDLRYRNLRGIYLRVIEEGEAAPGDPVAVIERV